MDALTRRADLLDVDVPRAVWARGKRPWRGTLIRVGVAAGLLVMALVIPVLGARIALAGLGIAVLMFTTPFADRRLAQLETKVRGADRSQAARLLVGIERAPLVDLFATHAWVALQKGRLNLVLGNGRAAAKAFLDASKYADDPNNVALASAQVHAHVLAGDRKDARTILVTLEDKQQLAARDRLDYGLVLLDESGRTTAARAHLEAAREALGGHPRVLAALALAYARGDDGPKALEMLRVAEESEDVAEDELATELLRRARKAARPLLEAEEKRARRAKPSADAASSDAARPAAAKSAKKDKKATQARRAVEKEKKDRRKERREKRKADRSTTRAETPIDPQVQAEAEARAAEKRAAVERHEADERARAEREAAEKRAEAVRRAEAMKQAEAETREAERRAAEQREIEKREVAAREAERLAEAKKRADAELEAAARDAAARTEAERKPAPKPATPPVFAPPPIPVVPDVPKAPTVSAPPVVSAPAVPKVDSAPAVDSDGWDDLLGDAPAPKPKT